MTDPQLDAAAAEFRRVLKACAQMQLPGSLTARFDARTHRGTRYSVEVDGAAFERLQIPTVGVSSGRGVE